MNETKRGFIQLHLSVLLAGFTGLFGRLITLNEVDIVWYRMLFTSCILLVFTGLPRVGRQKLLQLTGCGALLGFHWILFYGSIKASNVSIGVICFSLIGFFTAIFEPLISRKRFSWLELLFSLITVAGVLCIFSFDARYRRGILIGVVSSAVCALYAICNKRASKGLRSRTVLMYQMTGGLAAVSLIIPLYLRVFPAGQPVVVVPAGSNLWLMLCHALFCTVGMYLLQIQALKRLSAFTVNLTYNLEPCYTIVLAFLLFGEGRELNFSFYLGIGLIVLSVLLQSLRVYQTSRHKNPQKTIIAMKSPSKKTLLLLAMLMSAGTLWAQRLPATAKLADKKEYAGLELYVNVEREASEDEPASVVSVWLRNTATGRAERLLTTNPMAQGRWSQMKGHSSVGVPLTEIAAADKAVFVADETDLILVEGCPDARNVWSYLVDLKTRTAKQLPTNAGLMFIYDEGPFILMTSYRYDFEGETGRFDVIQAFRPNGTFVGELPLGPVEE